MKDQSYKRHIAKTVTWRIVGTIDTIILSWIVTGNPLLGLKIGLAEVFTKSILYFLHERVWFKLNLKKDGQKMESRKRHIFKTVSWRIIGTMDTMTLAWIISGNPLAGLKIGGLELFTKMLFYYLHERVWYKVNYGLDRKLAYKRIIKERKLRFQTYNQDLNDAS